MDKFSLKNTSEDTVSVGTVDIAVGETVVFFYRPRFKKRFFDRMSQLSTDDANLNQMIGDGDLEVYTDDVLSTAKWEDLSAVISIYNEILGSAGLTDMNLYLGLSENTDNTLEDFLDGTAIVTDSYTGLSGPFYLMQILVNRREIFNDDENPIYNPSVVPILGDNGLIVASNTRILNLETIHGKNGWHEQQVTKSLYKRPKDLCIYYGYPSSFNYGDNGWNPEYVAQDMARYGIVVLGNGVADSSHPDYANTVTIVSRIKDLNPNTKIFGYVSVNQTLTNFETVATQWNTLGVHGIFFDEAGYDYGSVATNGREAFNEKVDYVHGLSSANLCFANSWNMDHIIGIVDDVSYPNSTYNEYELVSTLTSDDFYLLESYAVNTLSYTGNYATKADVVSRSEKAVGHRYTFGINLVSSGVIADGDADEQDLFDFSFVLSCMYAFEAHGTSDSYYGSSSAKCKLIERPDVSKLESIFELSPSVTEDALDSDVLYRYADTGKLSVDFSDGAKISVISSW